MVGSETWKGWERVELRMLHRTRNTQQACESFYVDCFRETKVMPLNHNQNTRNNKYAARIPRVKTEAGKRPFGSKVQNCMMNFPAAFAS